MNYFPGGMFGGMYGQAPMTSSGGWNTANGGGYAGMPSQSAMNSDAMMRQNFMRSGAARFGGRGGMFGSFQNGPQDGGFDTGTQYSGGRNYQQAQADRYGGQGGGQAYYGGSPTYDETTGQRDFSTWSKPGRLPAWAQQGGERFVNDNHFFGSSPKMSTGYTVNEPMPQTGGSFNPMVGSQFDQGFMVRNNGATFNGPQMSQPYQATQQQAPMQQARPQQSFEDFASTLSGSGMTSGQMNDLYQAQIAKASAPTNFWQNVGPGGTQNPFPQSPQPFPQNWGQQRFNFDPRSLAGQQVTGDLGWYYGRDAIGRTINAQGDAVTGFSRPADGFQRTRPWFGGM